MLIMTSAVWQNEISRLSFRMYDSNERFSDVIAFDAI